MTEVDKTGCIGNTIATASGRYFDYNNSKPSQVCIEDIARALGNTCRYGGHCSQFYSVAEHCWHCWMISREREPANVEFHMLALMHDAAEAYIGDMPKPLKNMMPEFRELEQEVEQLMFDVFALEHRHKQKVKEIDLAMLKAEKKVLFSKDERNWTGLECIPDASPCIMNYVPKQATSKFIRAYVETMSRRTI